MMGVYLKRDIQDVSDHSQNGAGDWLKFLHHEPSDRFFARGLGSGALILIISELFRIGHCLLIIEQEVHHLLKINSINVIFYIYVLDD
jgi:hypothetical protein